MDPRSFSRFFFFVGFWIFLPLGSSLSVCIPGTIFFYLFLFSPLFSFYVCCNFCYRLADCHCNASAFCCCCIFSCTSSAAAVVYTATTVTAATVAVTRTTSSVVLLQYKHLQKRECVFRDVWRFFFALNYD